MIYLVEDDENIRELVVYTLNSTGLPTVGFAESAAFWQAMQERVPDLILLDIMLPGEDGLSVLSRLRAQAASAAVPVIMLTAKGSEIDKVKGFEAGADDYIAKPFGVMELVARVKARLRGRMPAAVAYTCGALCVFPQQHIAQLDGSPIALTRKEFQLLCLLLENRGTVLTRDQILDHVWGYAFDGENRTVDVHVRTLRQKLGAAGALVETVRGIGYCIREHAAV